MTLTPDKPAKILIHLFVDDEESKFSAEYVRYKILLARQRDLRTQRVEFELAGDSACSMCLKSYKVSMTRVYLVVRVQGPITASGADLGLSGTFTNLAIIVLSGHFLDRSTRNKSGQHNAVYNRALHASEHELLAFSSHFARGFYFRPPKSTTLFSNYCAKK